MPTEAPERGNQPANGGCSPPSDTNRQGLGNDPPVAGRGLF